LLGPNGAGKTSILDAIAYTLAGANHLTTADGKMAQRMVRRGAKSLMVTLDWADWGIIERGREGGKTSLVIPSAQDSNPATNQALLLRHLNVPQETLLALLDAKPLLSRSPAEQKEIMLRVLRPPEIKPTLVLVEAGIRQILSVEHLDKLREEWKTEKLRDLNRELRQLEQAVTAKPPEWPFPGHTEAQATELLPKLRAKRDELIAARSRMAESKARTMKALDAPLPSLEGLLDDAGVQSLQVRSKDNDEQISSLEELSRACQAGIVFIKELPHCKTCSCPKDARELAGLTAHLAQLQKALAAKREEYKAISEAMAAHRTAVKVQAALAKEPSREGLESKLAEAVIHLSDNDLETREIDQRIAKGEGILAQIQAYNRALAAAEATAKRQGDLMALEIPKVQRVIGELDRMREQIVATGAESFLGRMNEFLLPFVFPAIRYDYNQGFLVGDLPADWVSRGEGAMLFEAAFRVAVAHHTGVGLVVFDHDAPVDDINKSLLGRALQSAGVQVIQTWTLAMRPKEGPPSETVKRYWIMRGNDETARVEEIT